MARLAEECPFVEESGESEEEFVDISLAPKRTAMSCKLRLALGAGVLVLAVLAVVATALRSAKTLKSADVSATTEEMQVLATESFATPIDDDKLVWLMRPGYNCTGADGAVPGKSPMEGTFTSLSCMAECEMEPLCAAVTFGHEDVGQCWLHKSVKLSACIRDAGSDVQERAPVAPKIPAGVWESFGQHTACRLSWDDKTEDGNATTMVYGAASLEACKGLCGTVDNCYGIEYEPVVTRCEVWTEPIDFIVPVQGYECFSFRPKGLDGFGEFSV